ncbi:hypothetical protein Droror1_Dr00009605 [Drosera rotundifolia]
MCASATGVVMLINATNFSGIMLINAANFSGIDFIYSLAPFHIQSTLFRSFPFRGHIEIKSVLMVQNSPSSFGSLHLSPCKFFLIPLHALCFTFFHDFQIKVEDESIFVLINESSVGFFL